jgi:hypothetical protein
MGIDGLLGGVFETVGMVHGGEQHSGKFEFSRWRVRFRLEKLKGSTGPGSREGSRSILWLTGTCFSSSLWQWRLLLRKNKTTAKDIIH